MWRTVLVAVFLVLAGCTTFLPGPADRPTTDADAPGQQALQADGTDRANPWDESTLTVAVNDTVTESRHVGPLVREALGFWSNSSTEYAGFGVEFEYAPDAEDPDIVVEFVERIDNCANVTEPAGCAPYVTDAGQISRPITVEIAANYSNASTVLILKHELGHTLGLNHSAEPSEVMAPTSQLTSLPSPNATDRALPWRDSNFTVYVEVADTADAPDAAAVRTQVGHALDYYADGANGTVPTNVSYDITDNRTKADVVVEYADDLPCRETDSGSCGRVQGIDPDGDGALERYNRLRITVSAVESDAVGWHVGYWLGYGFGFEDESEWPAPFRDSSLEDRRSSWW